MLAEIQTINHPITTMQMRPPTLADAAAVADLVNASAMAHIGKPEANTDQIRLDWQSPNLNMATNVRVVENGNGRIAGVIEVWDSAPIPVNCWVWARVHPEHEGQGVGTMMMDWAEERLQETVQRVPDGLRVAFHSNAECSIEAAYQFLLNRPMTRVRHFWQMSIDLNQTIPQPEWPAGIRLSTFAEHNDLRALCEADNDAFRDHWGYVEQPLEVYLKEMEHRISSDKHFDPKLWFLALDGDEIAGFCLCKTHRYDDPNLGWVSVLGVRRPWRRKGLALAMLNHAFGVLQTLGKSHVGLGVDAESLTGATRLYEKAGMTVARRFDTFEKELRPGRDISRKS